MPGPKGQSGFVCLFLVALIVLVNYALPGGALLTTKTGAAVGAWTLVAWLVTLLAIILMLRAIGIALNGRPAGVIIDNRNRISLSKAQMIGWTALVLSGLTTLGATMLAGLARAPLSLAIDGNLLALMGISATSLVAAPTLLSLKTAAVDSRPVADNARWTDMVQGDDESNKDAPDLSKVQQLLVTLLVMGIYVFMLGNMLRFGAGAAADGRLQLPVLSADLIWLIGISHVGYLSYKAVPHSENPGNSANAAARAAGEDDGGVG